LGFSFSCLRVLSLTTGLSMPLKTIFTCGLL
jgi:hypothetical protein